MTGVLNHLIDSVFSKPIFLLVILIMVGRAIAWLSNYALASKTPVNVAELFSGRPVK